MSFINDLRRKALGIFPSEGNAGDMSGETAMDINYDLIKHLLILILVKNVETNILEWKNFNLFLTE